MAWNPSPKVADCREIARKWGKQQVIVLAVDPVAGTLEMATYGQTRELCAEAKRLGDHAYQAVMDHYEDDVLPGARLSPANTMAHQRREAAYGDAAGSGFDSTTKGA